jgi:RNA polymerase sigma-70 factor (ECF subfamily)
LRDVLDWQANEVADLLEMTVSAVKSALHRARTTLAEYDEIQETKLELDEIAQVQLDDYVRAWETADINLLLTLLKEDATFSMPPIPSWYQGHEAIRGLTAKTIFSGQANGRWRLLPTRANRQIAFGLYRIGEKPGTYLGYGIQVVTHRRGMISDITTFRNPTLLSHFKLPMTL